MRKGTVCPWCKAEMEILSEDDTYCRKYYLYCKDCNSTGPTYHMITGKKRYDVEYRQAIRAAKVKVASED